MFAEVCIILHTLEPGVSFCPVTTNCSSGFCVLRLACPFCMCLLMFWVHDAGSNLYWFTCSRFPPSVLCLDVSPSTCPKVQNSFSSARRQVEGRASVMKKKLRKEALPYADLLEVDLSMNLLCMCLCVLVRLRSSKGIRL